MNEMVYNCVSEPLQRRDCDCGQRASESGTVRSKWTGGDICGSFSTDFFLPTYIDLRLIIGQTSDTLEWVHSLCVWGGWVHERMRLIPGR